jgi:anti-anti-sigma regulatory factor
MTMVTSSFFDVSTVGDVTVIELKDATGQRRDYSNKVDLKTLIHQVQEPTQPLAIEIWQQLRHDLLLLLDTEKPRKVVLDFGGLHRIGHQPVISTAMNSVYVSARNHSSGFGCQWRLCGLAEDLETLFVFCGLSRFFPDLHDTQSEAVATFSAAETEPT